MPELWKHNREKSCFCLLSLSAGTGKGDDVRQCEQREKGGQRGEKGKWGGLIHLLFKAP